MLHGAGDKVTSEADARAVAARAKPEAKVVEVTGATHDALHQTPDRRVWGPVLDFALAASASDERTPAAENPRPSGGPSMR